MRHNDQGCFELGKDEFGLLVWEIPNEVINGFVVNNFEQTIGVSKEELTAIAKKLRSKPESGDFMIDRGQALILRNALAAALQELGLEEFQTRTGHDFQDGRRILRRLDELIFGSKSQLKQ